MNRFLRGDDDDSSSDEEIDIHEIVRTENLAEVRAAIVRDRPRMIALKDKEGRIPLHYAVQLNRERITLYLIAKHSNINARDGKERTPLHLAAEEGHTDMCRLLFDFNVKASVKDIDGWTPLHHAVKRRHISTTTLLIKRGANLQAEDFQFGRTPLHIAAEQGDHVMCEMLIVRGADLAASGDKFFSKTPLHLACIEGHTETVRVLCERNANVNALSGLLDQSPLHIACERGHTDCVRLLVKHKARINDCGISTNGKSPLHIAVESNHWNVCEALLSLKADVFVEGKFSTMGTPLHCAARLGLLLVARLLLDHDVVESGGVQRKHRLCDAPDAQGHTALHVACRAAHYDLAAALIAEGAQHSALSLAGKRPLDLVPRADALQREALQIACDEADQRALERERENAFRERVEKQRETDRLRAEREERERVARAERAREREQRRFLRALWRCVNVSGEFVALREIAREFPEKSINVRLPESELDLVLNDDNEDDDGRTKSSAASVLALQRLTESATTAVSLSPTDERSLALTTTRTKKSENNKNKDFTPLSRAAQRGFTQVLLALLRWPGVDIDLCEAHSGCTALHRAAQSQERECVEALLFARADVGRTDRAGKVAANYAQSEGLRELLRNPHYLRTARRLQDEVWDEIFARRERAIVSQTLSVEDTLREEELLCEARERATKTLSLPRLSVSPSPSRSLSVSPERDTKRETERVSASLPALRGPQRERETSSSTSSSAAQAMLRAAESLCAPLGPLPRGFGGCRGDMFSLPLSPATHCESSAVRDDTLTQDAIRTEKDAHYATRERERETETETERSLFVDVFALQRSYPPTAPDSVTDWCAVKDFLWLLGHPYAHRTKGHGSRAERESEKENEREREKESEGEREGARENERESEAQQAAHGAVDKRAIVHSLAVAMDDLQRVFITPASEMSRVVWAHREERETSRVTDADLLDSPSLSPSPSPPLSLSPSLSLSVSSLPRNLSERDWDRLQVFSDYALRFLKQFLRLYDTHSIDYYDSLSRREKVEYYHTHVVYLRDHRYVDWRTGELLEALLGCCDVLRHRYAVPSFTDLQDVVRAERERKRQNSLSRRNSARALLNITAESNESVDAAVAQWTGMKSHAETERRPEDDDDDAARFADPLREQWSELVLNPPRAMRTAIDAAFELASATKHQLESAFPQDVVRAQLWAHYGGLVLRAQREEEAQNAEKIRQHAVVSERVCKEKEKARAAAEAKQRAAEKDAKRFVSKFARPAAIEDGAASDMALSLSAAVVSLPPLVGAPATGGDESSSLVSSASLVAMSVPVSALQCWLQELHLLEYEAFFANMGFRLLEDFEELSESDCYRYFPFLRVGDVRRLAKHCEAIDDELIKKFKRKASKRSSVPLPDNAIET